MKVSGYDFQEVWLVDFEFQALSGENPTVICLVARELGSGQLLRLWRDEIVRLDQAEIISQQASERSIMPEGLLEGFSERDLADLYRYLKSL